ncbi:MAG: hypothetical protein ABR571_07225 [Jatrophihabitans sp.]|uniref:hypothetical protein n=1 Tax=Jatrophihabitans sp. TaxID=1932789 RepID=UPI003912BED4
MAAVCTASPASGRHAETRGAPSKAQLGYVVAGFGELTAQPDAVAAVRAAGQAGYACSP